MKIRLIAIGKTDEKYLAEGLNIYLDRLKHYVSFEVITLNDIKHGVKLNVSLQKEKEGQLFLSKIKGNQYVVLLDENGKSFTSVEFSSFFQKKMNSSQDLVFLIGGPFGFSPEIYARANEKLSISAMTFSHQMVRLFFVEQVYRAFTILKGEQYHNS